MEPFTTERAAMARRTQQAIIADYRNHDLSRDAILAKWHITRYALEKLLRTANVEHRRHGDMHGRPPRPNDIEGGSPEAIERFTNDFHSGMSYHDLAATYGLTWEALRRIVISLGLHHRHDGKSGMPRKAVDDTFFDALTPASAWVLGLWITDGWLTLRGTSKRIGIAFKDEDLLRNIHTLLQSETAVHFNPKTVAWKFQVTSDHLYDQLFVLGVCGLGTNRIHVPAVPDDLFPHLVRGIIDGDGSIVRHGGDNATFCTTRVTCMHRTFLSELSEHLALVVGIKSRIYGKQETNKALDLVIPHRQSLKLFPWLYKDSEGIRLERKYQTALHFLNLKAGSLKLS